MVRTVQGTKSPRTVQTVHGTVVRTVQEGTNSPRYEQSKVRIVREPCGPGVSAFNFYSPLSIPADFPFFMLLTNQCGVDLHKNPTRCKNREYCYKSIADCEMKKFQYLENLIRTTIPTTTTTKATFVAIWDLFPDPKIIVVLHITVL